MQYGVDILPYKRVIKQTNKAKRKRAELKKILKGMIYFGIGLLISRVTIVNSLAPFGIALLIAFIIYNYDELFLFLCSGCLIGYLTIYNSIDYFGEYIVGIAVITLIGFLYRDKSKVKSLSIILSTLIIEFSLYKFMVMKLSIALSILLSLCEISCIFVLYYIIGQSIICFKKINTKHLFTNEEIISMCIFISILIAGTYQFRIYNIHITNILALLFILTVGYINGIAIGISSGVLIGIITGMCYQNMPIFITVYSICGLVSGIFKDTNKKLTSIGFIITFSSIVIYCKEASQFKLLEPIISSTIFCFLPIEYYNSLRLEFNDNNKEKYISGDYINNAKEILVKKLNNFSNALDYVSTTIVSLNENDKLSLKNKSTALIESLADRVCSNCNLKGICWKREMHYTYTAFSELIENYQNSRYIIPKELDNKCIKKEVLIKNTEHIINNYIVDELMKKRFAKGRNILSHQINDMSESIKEIVKEVNDEISFNIELENDIIKGLNKRGIKFRNVICFSDKNGHNIIKMKLKACSGRQFCVKKILPIINDITKANMCVEEDGCNIDNHTRECTVTFEEMPKYYVSSYVEKRCKEGEQYSGDSFNYSTLSNGNYIMVLSDGMGSGPEAGEESNSVVKLIEKFMKIGFSKENVINIVNSIMSLKFCDEEKFSTVDLCNIDLYNGEADFIKVGAVTSFIKRTNGVEVIKSNTLPIGILDKIDVEINKYKVNGGDIIVMISDGVMDYNDEQVGKDDWIVKYLENIASSDPKEIAKDLIEKSIKLSNNKIRDDMTVVVSKVYDLY